jgi:hypothetical protein
MAEALLRKMCSNAASLAITADGNSFTKVTYVGIQILRQVVGRVSKMMFILGYLAGQPNGSRLFSVLFNQG